MAEVRALVWLAQNAEDVASGLHLFRDQLPRDATWITTIIGELFAVSSVLRKLDNAQLHPRDQPSFYRIKDDLALVFPSLRDTLDACLDMFRRAKDRPHQMVWDDLNHQMESVEGAGLEERLQWYHDMLQDLYELLDGVRSNRLESLRRRIVRLNSAQNATGSQRRPVNVSSASTPRPGLLRPISYRHIEPPMSPTSLSDDWDRGFPPPLAPDPPPVSPTFTSSSSQTLDSSQTSYSSAPYVQVGQPIHWALEVFNGQNPTTPFVDAHQLDDRSMCYSNQSADALRRLAEDGFIRALELSFDRDSVWIRFYWRPSDSRARILFITKDVYRRDLFYSVPLTQLKIIREKSTLQLCRARRTDGTYQLWAKLNFLLYERMVLFYSTFIAMKRQDTRDPPPENLVEDFELREREEFGGVIRDGSMLHALRLFRDRSSGVVRLEASPLRGAFQDVPLWTAFITRYAHDPDWLALENNGVVSMAALKPPPYVFLAGYPVPTNRKGEHVLNFETKDDAVAFVRIWTGLCRASK